MLKHSKVDYVPTTWLIDALLPVNMIQLNYMLFKATFNRGHSEKTKCTKPLTWRPGEWLWENLGSPRWRLPKWSSSRYRPLWWALGDSSRTPVWEEATYSSATATISFSSHI